MNKKKKCKILTYLDRILHHVDHSQLDQFELRKKLLVSLLRMKENQRRILKILQFPEPELGSFGP